MLLKHLWSLYNKLCNCSESFLHFNFIINTDTIFYSKYFDTINVISDSNGGTIRTNGSEAVTIKVAAGNKIGGINLSVDFVGNNTFCGWYIDSQSTNSSGSILDYVIIAVIISI